MEIKKVYKESVPQVKLVGKRLTNNDQDETGTFARYWQLKRTTPYSLSYHSRTTIAAKYQIHDFQTYYQFGFRLMSLSNENMES